jgi:hypothetical protein
VIAVMVVVLDEGGDLAFEIAGQVVVLKQDAILERLMPALDLALGLWVIRGAADVLHFRLIQPLREICRDVMSHYSTAAAVGERRSSDRALKPPASD